MFPVRRRTGAGDHRPERWRLRRIRTTTRAAWRPGPRSHEKETAQVRSQSENTTVNARLYRSWPRPGIQCKYSIKDRCITTSSRAYTVYSITSVRHHVHYAHAGVQEEGQSWHKAVRRLPPSQGHMGLVVRLPTEGVDWQWGESKAAHQEAVWVPVICSTQIYGRETIATVS